MESIKRKQFNRYIEQFDFNHLFNQLGWDYVDHSFPKKAADQTFHFQHIADKAGFAILICKPDSEGNIPDAQTRKRIHTEISKLHHEHLIIFVDKVQTIQQWELIVREPNKPARVVSHKWINGQAPELLYQKLSGAFFSIEEDEEGSLTIIDVVQRIKENFGANAEKVTKKFYAEFKKQHSQFLDFIKGIDEALPDKDNTNKQWYASLMLNRLMFCYFIQKKGFLDQDKHYLKNKLNACQALSGNDKFYSFYRSFLLELFHDGLGNPINMRSADQPVELGKIPYLNGGLFDVHELERQFDEIQIDDDAFERIFEFFDKWEWHLDTRQHAEGKTINPDVIGYIFEKYINDRAAMGAYYTKEDITDYIGKNTIIPFLFDETQRHYKACFRPEGELWGTLKSSGDTYIYDAVKYGIPQEGELFDDLPEDVLVGFNPELEMQEVTSNTSPHLWEIRKPWNHRAPQDIGLPTELYRELIERRKLYAKVKSKIQKGEITQITDLITHNLDIRQFTQDFIERTKDPVFIRHFYKVLSKITILDPTCGSGAFLFAAMNILEPLYETCIKRMEEFTEEQPGKYKFFEETLKLLNNEEHPHLQYFIYKSIILNNIFGVDIMKEAVEIAKLRLFLKLVAVVDVDTTKENFGLEPLPDIDFNIRAGNTLIGFTTDKELKEAIQQKDALFYDQVFEQFREDFDFLGRFNERFTKDQLWGQHIYDKKNDTKIELNIRLRALNHKLNVHLATNYGIDAAASPEAFQHWLQSHQPFHWFAEFYRIVDTNGGFDCIIGNPPYVEYTKIKGKYSVIDFKTIDCGNIYTIVIEQSMKLISSKGIISMIVPMSITSSQRTSTLQKMLMKFCNSWISNFEGGSNPSVIFNGVKQNLTIIILKSAKSPKVFSTKLQRCYSTERNALFQLIEYSKISRTFIGYGIPKYSTTIEEKILCKLFEKGKLGLLISGNSNHSLYVHRIAGSGYHIKCFDFVPYFANERDGIKRSEDYKLYRFDRDESEFIALINSTTFYFYWQIFFDAFKVGKYAIHNYPYEVEPNDPIVTKLKTISQELLQDLKDKKERVSVVYKNTGMVEYDQFFPRESKVVVDKIDTELGHIYNMTESELDFTINYNIKYRMSKTVDLKKV